jgi:phosphatidylglycerol:prolipoprotein diacylglycerol transferase
MIINAITWNVRPEILPIGSFELRWYSILFATGFVLGYMILSKVFKKEGISQEILDKLTIYVVIGTVLGARLGHCLFYEPEYYLKHPLEMILPFQFNPFRLTGFQGLASHGGMIGILIAIVFFVRKFKKPYFWVIDRLAMVAALAGSFIRWGNLMNSEIYGTQTDLPWGFRFMMEQYYEGTAPEAIVPKHPTQIYEALSYLAIFFLLRFIYNKNNGQLKNGILTSIFMIATFTARFFIEFIKEDQVGFEEGMSLNMGQWLSVPFVLLGIAGLIYLKNKPAKT